MSNRKVHPSLSSSSSTCKQETPTSVLYIMVGISIGVPPIREHCFSILHVQRYLSRRRRLAGPFSFGNEESRTLHKSGVLCPVPGVRCLFDALCPVPGGSHIVCPSFRVPDARVPGALQYDLRLDYCMDSSIYSILRVCARMRPSLFWGKWPKKYHTD